MLLEQFEIKLLLRSTCDVSSNLLFKQAQVKKIKSTRASFMALALGASFNSSKNDTLDHRIIKPASYGDETLASKIDFKINGVI